MPSLQLIMDRWRREGHNRPASPAIAPVGQSWCTRSGSCKSPLLFSSGVHNAWTCSIHARSQALQARMSSKVCWETLILPSRYSSVSPFVPFYLIFYSLAGPFRIDGFHFHASFFPCPKISSFLQTVPPSVLSPSFLPWAIERTCTGESAAAKADAPAKT